MSWWREDEDAMMRDLHRIVTENPHLWWDAPWVRSVYERYAQQLELEELHHVELREEMEELIHEEEEARRRVIHSEFGADEDDIDTGAMAELWESQQWWEVGQLMEPDPKDYVGWREDQLKEVVRQHWDLMRPLLDRHPISIEDVFEVLAGLD